MNEINRRIHHHELGFDIDGVIADTFRKFVEIARHQYGVSIQYEDITEYDFRNVIDIDDESAREIIRRILDDPLGIGIQPIQGAVTVLKKLLKLGPLLLVTARPGREGILEWLEQHFEMKNTEDIFLEATGTHQEKLPILLDRGIKYFVEDRLETCYLLEEASIVPIVFEQPWNLKPHPFQRVKDWEELSRLIEWEKIVNS